MLALTATAGSLAAGMPFNRGGVLVQLLSVLVATRWCGRTAGYAAVLSSGAFALLQLGGGAAPPTGVDALAFVLLGLIGGGIAAWTGSRAQSSTEPRAESRRAKEEFLATVSHELRTPLNAILGWTALLRTRRSDGLPQVERGLEVIERNARRQLALVDELLAAVEPGTLPQNWQLLDIREMLDALLASLGPRAETARVRLAVDEPGASRGAAGDPVWVHGDATSLRLALGHVLDNAIKYTPPGGDVCTRVRQCGDRAMIFVSDTGGGIEASKVEQVFEPFQQADGSAARRFGGLGLGLTIARKLVERHGGHVDLRSGASGGATVLVTLPARARPDGR